MNKIKNNWQFIAILITVVCIFATQIANYTRLESKVQETEKDLIVYIEMNEVDKIKFDSQIEKLTVAVTRSNTLLEMYFMKKGIIRKKEDIDNYK